MTTYTFSFQILDGSGGVVLSQNHPVDADVALQCSGAVQNLVSEPGPSRDLEETFEISELEPETKPSFDEIIVSEIDTKTEKQPESKVKNIRKNTWLSAEIQVVARSSSANKAVEGYFQKYPDSKRSSQAVMARWYALEKSGSLINPILVDMVVEPTDEFLPQYGESGRVLKVKDDQALVQFTHSAVWILTNALEAVKSPGKN